MSERELIAKNDNETETKDATAHKRSINEVTSEDSNSVLDGLDDDSNSNLAKNKFSSGWKKQKTKEPEENGEDSVSNDVLDDDDDDEDDEDDEGSEDDLAPGDPEYDEEDGDPSESNQGGNEGDDNGDEDDDEEEDD